MVLATIPRPDLVEYEPHYESYVSRVPAGDLLTILEDQRRETQQLLSGIGDAKALYRYAPGTRSRCAPSRTSSPDTSGITWRSCGSATCGSGVAELPVTRRLQAEQLGV